MRVSLRDVGLFWFVLFLATPSFSGEGPATLTWVATDPHVHSQGCFNNKMPGDLIQEMVDSNIQVASALISGQRYALALPFFTGVDDPASLPGHILHYDLEISHFAASQLGHPTLLGLSEIEFSDNPFETPGTGLPVVQWALDQGPRVLVGMNHAWAWPSNGSFPLPGQWCCTPFEFPVHVANGTVSYLADEFNGSTSPVTPSALLLWRVVQNSGFRIAIAAASDFPCIGDSVGSKRTHVLIEGDLSYEAYLDGIRAGRTSVAIGGSDRIDLTLEGVRLGGEVQTTAGSRLQGVIESDLSAPALAVIRINGIPLAGVPLGAGPQTRPFNLTLGQSSWISVSTPRAMTSAIYVLVDGQPIRASADDACYLVRYMDYLTDLVLSGELEFDATEALLDYQRARDLFVERFYEAGGVICEDLLCFPQLFGQTILASDADTLTWSTPQDVHFVKGDLTNVGSYGTLDEGTLLGATALDISADVPGPDSGLYYLLRLVDCGSWQTSLGSQPDRDAVLP